MRKTDTPVVAKERVARSRNTRGENRGCSTLHAIVRTPPHPAWLPPVGELRPFSKGHLAPHLPYHTMTEEEEA